MAFHAGVVEICENVEADGVGHTIEGKNGVVEVKHLLLCTWIIEKAGIPVAVFCFALWAPVSPNTKLGVLEPLRAVPLAYAGSLGSIAACCKGHIGFLGCYCQWYCRYSD